MRKTKGRIDHECTMEDADRHGGLLFSKLIGFDAEGNPKNEVTDSIEVNDGNTEYTITLKKGWTFTDGTEVKAENFTRAWSYGANAAKQDYQQAQEILFKDLPAVPLWYANNKGVAAKNVKGFTLTWQGIEDCRNMTKE